MLAFAVAGIGNGLFLVTVRVLMQKLIPERAHGRAFGLLDAIDSWGFGAAIVAGGALAASLGGRVDLRDRRRRRAARADQPPRAPCAAPAPPSSPLRNLLRPVDPEGA